MMKNDFIIRDLEFGDFEGIVSTYFSYYDELRTNPALGLSVRGKKPSIAEEIDWFASTYKDMLKGNKIVLVAQADGRIVGMCDIMRARPGSSMDHKGILGVALHKDYRSHGIGSALVKEAIRRSHGKFEMLVLSAFANNKGAIKLYKRFGFKEYGFLRKSNKRGNTYFNEVFLYLNLRKGNK